MKKVCWFLIVVLLLGCFAGCHQQPVEGTERPIENEDGTLSDWMKLKIAADFAAYETKIFGEYPSHVSYMPFTRWLEDGYWESDRYYGIYEDYLVLYIFGGYTIGTEYYYYIGSYTFVDKSGRSFGLLGYKDGDFQSVSDLYAQGIFDDSTMEALLQRHNEFESY